MKIGQLALYVLLAIIPATLSCGDESFFKTTYHWKLQAQSPADNPDFIALKSFCSRINVISHGELEITPYPAGAFAKGAMIFDGVKERKFEMAMGWPNWWLGKDPAWSFIQSGPFEFMTIEESMLYFYEDEGIKIANELANPHGIIWRPAWWSGMEFGILTTFPVRGLADLRGKKIRIGPGIPQETLLEAAKCVALPTVPEEIYEGLQTGALQGVEWTVPSATWPMKFHEICRYFIVPAVWQPSVLGDFLINRNAYNELPKHLQVMLETAIRDFALSTTIKGKYMDMQYLEKYKEYGVKVTKWSKADIAKWRDASEKVYSRHINSSPSFKRIYESKMNFKKRYNVFMKTHGPYEDYK